MVYQFVLSGTRGIFFYFAMEKTKQFKQCRCSLIPMKYYMKIALNEAQNAFDEDEVPIGAIIVAKGKIIGKGTTKWRNSTM